MKKNRKDRANKRGKKGMRSNKLIIVVTPSIFLSSCSIPRLDLELPHHVCIQIKTPDEQKRTKSRQNVIKNNWLRKLRNWPMSIPTNHRIQSAATHGCSIGHGAIPTHRLDVEDITSMFSTVIHTLWHWSFLNVHQTDPQSCNSSLYTLSHKQRAQI